MSKVKMFHLAQLAAYYEKTFSDEQMRMYVDDLKELSDQETIDACKLYRSNSDNEFFPRPVYKLVNLIKKPISNDDVAQQIASKTIEAVSRFGYTWPRGSFDAKHDCFLYEGRDELGKVLWFKWWEGAAESFFGKQGLEIVRRFGGWQRYCEIVNESPDGVVRQQSARLARSMLNLKDSGATLSNLIGFPIKEVPKIEARNSDIPHIPYKDFEDL